MKVITKVFGACVALVCVKSTTSKYMLVNVEDSNELIGVQQKSMEGL